MFTTFVSSSASIARTTDGTDATAAGKPVTSLWQRFLEMVSGTQDDAELPVDPDTLVAGFRLCLQQTTIYIGETYTVNPEPVDARGGLVSGANLAFFSENPAVASVTSWGEVEALSPGTAVVVVRSGLAVRPIVFTVLAGIRPALSDDEWRAQHAADCTAVAPAEADKLTNYDNTTDPTGPGAVQATAPINQVGSPRMTAIEVPAQSAVKARHNRGSSNYSFAAPVLSLGGREAGVNLALIYNGQLWSKDDIASPIEMTFNRYRGWPAAGWMFGFGRIIDNYDGNHNYLLIQPDGTRIALTIDSASSPKYVSRDGTFLEYGAATGRLKYPDGTVVDFDSINGRILPATIKTKNGNFIKIAYRDFTTFPVPLAISSVTDTLGRQIDFHYYGDAAASDGYLPPSGDPVNNLVGQLYSVRTLDRSMAAGGAAGTTWRELVRLSYTNVTLGGSLFNAGYQVNKPSGGVTVVEGIYYPATGTGYTFDYTSAYGMIRKIHVKKDMTGTTGGFDVATTEYTFPTSGMTLADPPRFGTRVEWRHDGTNPDSLNPGVTATYTYTGTSPTFTVTASSASPDTIVTRTTVGTSGNDNGRPLEVAVYKNSVSMGNLMRKTEFTYTVAPAFDGGLWLNGDVQINTVVTTNEAGEMTKVDYDYANGTYGQVKQVDEFDFGATTKRRTTKYSYFKPYLAGAGYDQNLFYLVDQAQVLDGTTVEAKTAYTYDGYASLTTYASTPPMGTFDSTFDGTFLKRGNVTTVTMYTDPTVSPSSTIVHDMAYDRYGNVVTADVNCCDQKTYTFTGGTSGLYFSQPTSVTDGVSAPQLMRSATYDYATGLVLTATDERTHQTAYKYDPAWRVKTVTDPSQDFNLTTSSYQARDVIRTFTYDNGAGKDQLTRSDTFTYYDGGVSRTVTTKVWTDGAGNVVRRGVSPAAAGASFDAARMGYDAIGRMVSETNPYAGDADGKPTGTVYTTTYAYDALSRVIMATLPDSNTIKTMYSGKTTTVTDQVTRKRQSTLDGLGRLVTVAEQETTGGSLTWTTTYDYDVLDNTKSVKMYLSGSTGVYQERAADYDGLSRVKWRTTPEVNDKTTAPLADGVPVQETFTYTAFDAVDVYTDGRGATVDYDYDTLNRLTTITSSAGSSGATATAQIVLTYETAAASSKGLIKQVTDYVDASTAQGEEYFYDTNGLGRVDSRRRQIGTTGQAGGGRRQYIVSYKYNSIGQALTMTYPSGFSVKMGHDTRGRLLDVVKNVAGGTKYLTTAAYNSASLLTDVAINDNGASMKLAEHYDYSPQRLQLTGQRVTDTSRNVDLLNMTYSYQAAAGDSGATTTAGNSGQLMAITSGSKINGGPVDQMFTYDNVGRLVTATGPSGTGSGTDTIGVFRPSPSAAVYLRNTNTPGGPDVSFTYGGAGTTLTPIAGDWNGDGVDTIGLYDPSTGNFFLRNTNSTGSADITFAFGGTGLAPVVGDWDGDGVDTIGVYDTSTGNFFLRNSNSAGAADLTFSYGAGGAGNKAITGDWNGDGVDTIGLYNPTAATFQLRNTNSAGAADVTFGFGAAGSTPLAGDWNGDGIDTIGTYVSPTATFNLKNTNAAGAADVAFAYGDPNTDKPLIGDWDATGGTAWGRKYAYDRWGNRTTEWPNAAGSGPASQTVIMQGLSGQAGVPTNRIKSVTSPTTLNYTYDKAGGVKGDGVGTFTYDVLGRQVTAVGAQTATYVYDAGNRRTQKAVMTGIGTTITDYVWEGGQILAEYDRTTTTYTEYVWAGGRLAAKVVGGATTTYLHPDRLSTRLVTNSAGNWVGQQSQYPFGDDAGASGTTDKHRFTSYERDAETGTDYAVYRQHASDVGRFMRPDPMPGSPGAPQSFNRYSYTVNDPVNLVDPLGLSLRVCFIYVRDAGGERGNDFGVETMSVCHYFSDPFLGTGESIGSGSALSTNEYPGFKRSQYNDITKGLLDAAKILADTDCQKNLAAAGINVAKLMSTIAALKARPDSDPSSTGYDIFDAEKSTASDVIAFLKTEKGEGAGAFIRGNDIFVRRAFFGGRGGSRISASVSRAVALIHEAIHLTGLTDANFDGSQALNTVIIRACVNKLFSHRDLFIVGA